MPTQPMTHSEVKSVCDSLEVSPSQHQPSSSIYSAGSEPQAVKMAGGKSATEGKESNMGVARKKASKAPGAF